MIRTCMSIVREAKKIMFREKQKKNIWYTTTVCEIDKEKIIIWLKE